MLDRIDREIHVELRPVQVVRLRALHVEDRSHWRIREPGELLEREKQLSIPQEEPEAMLRDVGDFSLGNGGSRPRE